MSDEGAESSRQSDSKETPRGPVLDESGTRTHLAQVFDVVPVGVVVISAGGQVRDVNPAARALLGWEDGEPTEPWSSNTDLLSWVRTGPDARTELVLQRADGTTMPVEVSKSTFPDDSGSASIVILRDLRETRRAAALDGRHAEQEARGVDLEARSGELERLRSDLERLAQVASHDMHEPLRMIASYAELLAERYGAQLDERGDRYIGYIVDGAHRMQLLTDDLLAYARVGAPVQRPTSVDMALVASAVVRELGPAIQEAGADVTVAPMPVVRADSGQVHQVLANLVANALKFRGPRSPHISVDAAADSDGTWTFSVSDDGIGIDPIDAEKIFQMFTRLHGRNEYEGSGMGLAITRRIVEAHGGRIWFEPHGDQGTTFHFTLPQPELPE